MPGRRLVTAVAGTVLLVTLSGCEKPTPGVTLSSGSRSVHVESTVFCRDGQSAEKRNCVEHLSRVGIIKVKAGEPVAVDVDSGLAKHGWRVVILDPNEASPVQDVHHFSFTPQFNRGPVMQVEIRSLDRVADDARTTGVWKFQLVQD